MKLEAFALLSLLAFPARSQPETAQPETAPATQSHEVLEWDPIELARGERTVGREHIALRRGRFEYRFATEANRVAFLKDPENRAIQWNGACARMGPLSGKGQLALIAEHGGKLYIFASSQCRETFLAAPERLLERDELPPDVTPDARAEALALLARAEAAFGGTSAIAGATALRLCHTREEPSGGVAYPVRDEHWYTFGDGGIDSIVSESAWDASAWGTTLAGERGGSYSVRGGKRTEDGELEPSQRLAFLRERLRHPLVLLRVARSPDARVAPAGARELRGRGATGLLVAYAGANTTLWLDRENGEPLAVSFVGRGPNLAFGAREEHFAELVPVPSRTRADTALRLPSRVEVWHDGARAPGLDQTWPVLELDAEPAKREPAKR
ncbi:MAG: hypothetical protein GC161_11365 [Planctomycetaceae bacterium]|nr:hypothetical protein [Planctomycetaceae bacterium]